MGTPLPPQKKVDFSCLCFCSTLDDTVLTLAAGSWMLVHVAFLVGARQTPRPEPGTVGDSKCTEIKKEPVVFPRSVSPSGTRSGWDAPGERPGRPGESARHAPRRRSLRALPRPREGRRARRPRGPRPAEALAAGQRPGPARLPRLRHTRPCATPGVRSRGVLWRTEKSRSRTRVVRASHSGLGSPGPAGG